MGIRSEVNRDLISVSVYGSYEELVRHKGISFFVGPKNPTFDVTATSDSKLFQCMPIMKNIVITN